MRPNSSSDSQLSANSRMPLSDNFVPHVPRFNLRIRLPALAMRSQRVSSSHIKSKDTFSKAESSPNLARSEERDFDPACESRESRSVTKVPDKLDSMGKEGPSHFKNVGREPEGVPLFRIFGMGWKANVLRRVLNMTRLCRNETELQIPNASSSHLAKSIRGETG